MDKTIKGNDHNPWTLEMLSVCRCHGRTNADSVLLAALKSCRLLCAGFEHRMSESERRTMEDIKKTIASAENEVGYNLTENTMVEASNGEGGQVVLPVMRRPSHGGQACDSASGGVGVLAVPREKVARTKRGEAPCGFCGHKRADHAEGGECEPCAKLLMSNRRHKWRRTRPLPAGYHDSARR